VTLRKIAVCKKCGAECLCEDFSIVVGRYESYEWKDAHKYTYKVAGKRNAALCRACQKHILLLSWAPEGIAMLAAPLLITSGLVYDIHWMIGVGCCLIFSLAIAGVGGVLTLGRVQRIERQVVRIYLPELEREFSPSIVTAAWKSAAVGTDSDGNPTVLVYPATQWSEKAGKE
jgi:hypothetical protein